MASTTKTVNKVERRDFLYLATGTMAAAGAGAMVWPLVKSMSPSADVLSLSSTELDISAMEKGQRITVFWRGKPVFVDRRTDRQIEAAQDVDLAELKDPQLDSDRATNGEWLVLVGVCTHLGCVPLGQNDGDQLGDWGGWFCPCHGSHYDTSGRIRKGPAPENLAVPPHSFGESGLLTIG